MRPLPVEVRNAIRASILKGDALNTIAKQYNCSIQTVRHHRRAIRRFVETGVDSRKKTGRKRKISPDLLEKVKQFVETYPTAYLEEIQVFLKEDHGVVVTLQTVCRAVQDLRFTRKLGHSQTVQRDELRAYWISKLSNWTADQLVFLDEAGASDRSPYRRYGWAPPGLELHAAGETKRDTRWSMLQAYTHQGYIAAKNFQGSIAKDIYERFVLEEVLPQCTRFPGPRSVIVMDSASVYGSPKGAIALACQRAGVLLEFLPPQSPDYNPVNKSFKDISQWIKGNYEKIKDFRNFGDFLHYAICENSARNQAVGHFQRCEILVSG